MSRIETSKRLPELKTNSQKKDSLSEGLNQEERLRVSGGDGYLWEVGSEVDESKAGQGTITVDGKRYLLINPILDVD